MREAEATRRKELERMRQEQLRKEASELKEREFN